MGKVKMVNYDNFGIVATGVSIPYGKGKVKLRFKIFGRPKVYQFPMGKVEVLSKSEAIG